VVLIPVAGDNKDPLVVLIAGSIGTRRRFRLLEMIRAPWFLLRLLEMIRTRWRFLLQKVLIPKAGVLSQTTP